MKINDIIFKFGVKKLTIGELFALLFSLILFLMFSPILIPFWLYMFLKIHLPFNFKHNVLLYSKHLIKLLLFIILIWIAAFVLYIFMFLIEWFDLRNPSQVNWDKIKNILYILQIFIISIGIFVWYINYRELIRKNEWDHFPKMRIEKESIKSELLFWEEMKTWNITLKGDFILVSFSIENVWEEMFKVDVWNVSICWIWKETWTRNIERNLKFDHPYEGSVIGLENNLFFWKEKRNMQLYVNGSFINKLFRSYSTIKNIEIYFVLECYGIRKLVLIRLQNNNLNDWIDDNKDNIDFTNIEIKYL